MLMRRVVKKERRAGCVNEACSDKGEERRTGCVRVVCTCKGEWRELDVSEWCVLVKESGESWMCQSCV